MDSNPWGLPWEAQSQVVVSYLESGRESYELKRRILPYFEKLSLLYNVVIGIIIRVSGGESLIRYQHFQWLTGPKPDIIAILGCGASV